MVEFFRNRVTELRMSRNVSEYEMSLSIGRCRGYIQGISSGRTMPSMYGFFRICDYLNISPSDFFDPAKKASPEESLLNDYLVRLPESDVNFLLNTAAFLVEKNQEKLR
ncbi:MAG: helix-turn-helix transcriptional regulator [Lachnospiraceae bacterium]|nr:helix-turn-helix transcriptional regulator [Lachnospiraceae bacterium]